MTRWTSRATALPLVVAAAALAACGDRDGASSAGSCRASLRFNGELYVGTTLPVRHGAPTGRGVIACGGDDEDRTVTVLRIQGVSPALAVTREGAPRDTVFLAPGFFPVLRSHPLHDALVRRAGGLPRPRRCTARFGGTGVVPRTPSYADVPLLIRGRELFARVHETTRITGFRRAGHPFLQRGDLVEVEGRRCVMPDAVGGLVVDRIRPAP